jgi:hypothetical protein
MPTTMARRRNSVFFDDPEAGVCGASVDMESAVEGEPVAAATTPRRRGRPRSTCRRSRAPPRREA